MVAGGQKDWNAMPSATMYDITNQSYITLPNLPYAAGDCKGVVLKGYFYVILVRFELHRINLNERNKWEYVLNWGQRYITCMVTDCNRLFVIYNHM